MSKATITIKIDKGQKSELIEGIGIGIGTIIIISSIC